MTCRSCNAEIADKAIVCYRCGTPTADAATTRARPRPARARWIAVVIFLAFAIGAALWYWNSCCTTPTA